MESIYLVWFAIALLFVFVILIAGLRAGRATQRDEGATDVMFRRPSTRAACRAMPQRINQGQKGPR